MREEIQRLKKMGMKKKAVARTLDISRNTLKKYWDETLAGREPEGPGVPVISVYHAPWSEQVDWDDVRKAVDRGQALSHFWELYQEDLPAGDPRISVPYVSFWREYKRRFPSISLEFHQIHPPGSCCEVDYKGSRPGLGYTDPVTGNFVVCELFGAVLGFSQYLYADVTLTQQKSDFMTSMDGAYRKFSGVPTISVTDNMKTAVNRAHRYDPDLNPDFSGFCSHYGTVAIPTRPRKPKDKNLIEGTLKLFWRWMAPALSQQRFTTLSQLRDFVHQWADGFNARVQRRYGQSREQRLLEERSLLGPVPPEPYELCVWKKAKLHADCHVQVGKNFYSAPFTLRGQMLEVRITAKTIELFHKQDRVALHLRQQVNQMGRYRTEALHLPPAHKALLEHLPQALRDEARAIGPETEALVERLFALGNHPLRYLRRVQGLLQMARATSSEDLEKAVRMCVALGETLPGPRTLEPMIKLSRQDEAEELPSVERKPNPYLRGTQPIVGSGDQAEKGEHSAS